jgi:hypothetical protein
MLLALGFEEVPSTDQMKITSQCNHCKVIHDQYITMTEWKLWQEDGNYIQDVFPHLDAPQREMLLTGTHPECWKLMFPELEDDDEDEDLSI